ncbi:MAG: MurR/RpiR family transcriptional regulator [Lachnospiraceae bacterium]|nr:MurR/RpiR family transcriptional regulator [Lachnospiraceae bacterium]
MDRSEELSFVIKSKYASLRSSEKKTADFVLNHMRESGHLPLDELAKQAGVSQPTVLRFIRAIGFRGMKEFKYAIAAQEAMQEGRFHFGLYGFPLLSEDTVEDIPAKAIATCMEMLESTLKCISTDVFAQVVAAIKGGRRIDVYGVENSGSPASDLATKLLYLGLDCRYYGDYYLQRICAGSLTEEDVAIGISYSGCSRDTVDVMRIARQRGAATIVITNFRDSLIGKYADFSLCTTHEQFMHGDAIFSRTSQTAIVDMIYMGVLTSDYDRYAARLDENSRIIRDKAYGKENK